MWTPNGLDLTSSARQARPKEPKPKPGSVAPRKECSSCTLWGRGRGFVGRGFGWMEMLDMNSYSFVIYV